MSSEADPYLRFTGAEWSRLRADTPLSLSDSQLAALRGINERVSLDEVEMIYLPLSRLLNLHVTASQALHRVTSTFLGRPSRKPPYILAIAGSVAVGKSTTARILRELLARWPDHPRVELVTTDGFLFPNRVLQERGMMQRKGFPESYDIKRFVGFLADVKACRPRVRAPRYSHLHYDVLDDELEIDEPDILIVEGLNMLGRPAEGGGHAAVSDFFDFSIYVHAEETDIRDWFLERFRVLRETAFTDEASYFHRYATLPETEAMAFAHRAWDEINAVNLRENILPTRDRATLILEKASDHSVASVALRRR